MVHEQLSNGHFFVLKTLENYTFGLNFKIIEILSTNEFLTPIMIIYDVIRAMRRFLSYSDKISPLFCKNQTFIVKRKFMK